MNIFDLMYPRFKFDKDKPIRIMELFSGIGFQRMGMDLAEIKHETVGISEIDKFAINSYNLIHGDTKNYGDISKIKGAEAPKDIDIMTYSYPCQDLSNAGNQAGMGKGTRSGLVYEVLRLLQELKIEGNLPKVLIMENVPDLLGVKFVKEFHKIQLEIEEMGYKNYTEILNARDYGIAQNRRRVFMVSILGDYNYNFPQPFELETRLKDYLEDDVDESYYLSDKQVNQINGWNSQQNPIDNAKYEDDNHVQCITAKSNTSMNASMLLLKEQEPLIAASRGRNGKQQLEVNPSGSSNALTTVQKDNYILMPEKTIRGVKEAYEGDGVYINRSWQKRGVVQDGMIQTLKTSNNDVGVVVSTAKRDLTNAMLENGHLKEEDMVRHSYTAQRSEDLERKENENGVSATITTRADTLGVVVKDIQMKANDRISKQSKDTFDNNETEHGDVIQPYNHRVIKDGLTPTITTRPEGLKTAIHVVDGKEDILGTYIHKDSDSFLGNKSRFQEGKDVIGSIITGPREGVVESNLRIRKLTAKETGRLMGMNDQQIDKQLSDTSNSQAYKQHGNGIVAQVIGLIIGQLVYDDELELRKTVLKNSHTWLKKGDL